MTKSLQILLLVTSQLSFEVAQVVKFWCLWWKGSDILNYRVCLVDLAFPVLARPWTRPTIRLLHFFDSLHKSCLSFCSFIHTSCSVERSVARTMGTRKSACLWNDRGKWYLKIVVSGFLALLRILVYSHLPVNELENVSLYHIAVTSAERVRTFP